ncbi:MAG: NUDIX domain-containing protein [Patescibacteria group bacterium]
MAEPKTEERDGKIIHFSVGALIVRDNKILLMDRKKPPFGFAGPAGHIDENEDVVTALKREVREETGLTIKKYQLADEEFIPWNTCSRGIEGHYIYVYRCETEGQIRSNSSEMKSLKWYDLSELDKLKLEPVWDYWLRKLKVI